MLGRIRAQGEESAGGREISFLRYQDVDDLAELVDRPVQVNPPSGDFGVRFANKPLVARDVPAGSCRVDQQWGEPLYPPVHAHVIDGDASLG